MHRHAIAITSTDRSRRQTRAWTAPLPWLGLVACALACGRLRGGSPTRRDAKRPETRAPGHRRGRHRPGRHGSTRRQSPSPCQAQAGRDESPSPSSASGPRTSATPRPSSTGQGPGRLDPDRRQGPHHAPGQRLCHDHRPGVDGQHQARRRPVPSRERPLSQGLHEFMEVIIKANNIALPQAPVLPGVRLRREGAQAHHPGIPGPQGAAAAIALRPFVALPGRQASSAGTQPMTSGHGRARHPKDQDGQSLLSALLGVSESSPRGAYGRKPRPRPIRFDGAVWEGMVRAPWGIWTGVIRLTFQTPAWVSWKPSDQIELAVPRSSVTECRGPLQTRTRRCPAAIAGPHWSGGC